MYLCSPMSLNITECNIVRVISPVIPSGAPVVSISQRGPLLTYSGATYFLKPLGREHVAGTSSYCSMEVQEQGHKYYEWQ